ncbi:MAG: right-handed parallel beta-helix repeat-containing protein, partial [Thermoplasmatota archaeon]
MRLLSALIVLMLFVPGILTAPLWDAGSGTNGTNIPSGQGVFSFTPIVIDGNNDLENQAAARGWNGSGTSGSPYVIEDLVIETSSEYGVQIKNIDLYVVFMNCSFVSAAISGFYIESSENIVFLNISSVSRDDIFTFWRCTKIELENIDIRTNSVYTWAMVNYCDNITLVNSSLYGYIRIYQSEDILLDNITEKGYRSQAVYFRYSTRLTIRNSVFETTLIINARDSSGILITNNIMNGSRRSEFSNCHGIEIVGNMNSSGSPYGFSFDYCSDLAIRDNDLHGDRGTIILTGTSNVEMFNNTLGSNGLVLTGTVSVLGSLIIPANNTINGDPILFMKDGDITPMQDNPVHSQIILLNMTGFSLKDRQYDWNPCPLQVHYSSDIYLEGLTISNASLGFSAYYSSGITIDNCNFEYTRMTTIHIEHSDGISIRNSVMRHGSPDSVLWMKGCSQFELSSTVMDLDYCRDALYIASSQSGILRDLEIMTDYGSVYMETCNEIRFDRCSMKEYFEVEMYGCSDVFIRDSE